MANAEYTQFAIQKLKGENYSVWSYKLLPIKEKLGEAIKDEKPWKILFGCERKYVLQLDH